MKKIIFVFLVFIMASASVAAQKTDTIVGNYWQSLDSTTIDTLVTNKTVIKAYKKVSIDTVKIITKSAIINNTFHPEFIAIGGGGYNNDKSVSREGFGFIEGRLMCKIFNGLRLGPYLGYTQYSTNGFDPKSSTFLGKELKYGLSFDSYKLLNKTWSYYAWLNMMFGNVRDHYQDQDYESRTHTNLISFSGGFSIADELHGWFTHNQLMFDYQKPVGHPKIDATWKGSKVSDAEAYNKESYRIVLESGIKRLYMGKKTNFEPLIHLGYGKDFGSNQDYYEFGGGIGFGFFKDWYRDIFKVKAYWRNKQPDSRLNFEAVLNITSLINVIK